jgi:hypothetical protein
MEGVARADVLTYPEAFDDLLQVVQGNVMTSVAIGVRLRLSIHSVLLW